MNRQEVKKDLDKIIDEGMLGNLREKIIDYIEDLVESELVTPEQEDLVCDDRDR